MENLVSIPNKVNDAPAPKKELPVNRHKKSFISRAGLTHAIMLMPYVLGFVTFILAPVAVAFFLSFTDFNSIQAPNWVGIDNYIALLTQDTILMKHVLPNTITFSIIAGPVGYILTFILAWTLAQVQRVPRTILALVIYSPAMVGGATMTVIWKTLFSGDAVGLINSILLDWNVISAPIQWLQSPDYLMPLIIIVTVWGSMGIGFLAMIAGVLNVNQEIYEAAYIDGIKNRFQEIIHVTIPSMKPQMLFSAVMSVVGTFSAGGIGVELSGANPTPRYSAQMMANHIQDYGITRYEMGYSAAASVLLLAIIWLTSRVIFRLLGDNDKPARRK